MQKIKSFIYAVSILIAVSNMLACTEKESCPIEKNREKNSLFLEIIGLDTQSNSQFFIKTYTQANPYTQPNTGILNQYNINTNGCLRAAYIYNDPQADKAGVYEVAFADSAFTSNNQKCTIVSDKTGSTNYKDVVVKIDCKTKVNLQQDITNLEWDMDSKNIYMPPPIIKNTTNNLDINTKSFNYTSLDPEIVQIDSEGKLIFLQPGTAQIQLNAKADFYDSSQAAIYTINVVDRDIKVQSLDIGQSSVLDMGSKYQVIAPFNTTVVRALVHSKTPNNKLNNAQLKIINKNGDASLINLTCPPKLPNQAFSVPHYGLQDTCYAVLDTNAQLSNMRTSSIFEFDFDGIKRIAKPTISQPNNINIKLVQGANYLGDAQMPDLADIKKQMQQTFPLSSVFIMQKSDTVLLDYKLEKALPQLKEIWQQEVADGRTHYFGLVPANDCEGTVGLAYVESPPVATALECQNPDVLKFTMMHELGHNLGLSHAPCGEVGDTVLDDFWATSKAWPGVEKAYLSSSPIFDKSLNYLLKPTDNLIGNNRDLMAYCDGRRLSKHNYLKVANFLSSKNMYKNPNIAMGYKKTNSDYKRILSGEIRDNNIVLNPIQITSNPNINSVFMSNKFDYKVKVIGTKSNTIYPLQVKKLDHSSRLFFDLVLPYKEEILNLEFYYREQKIPYNLAGKSSKEKILARQLNGYTATKLDKESSAVFADNAIVWNSEKYPWMSSVYIDYKGKRRLLANRVRGGKFKIEQNLDLGHLEILLSSGLNNKVVNINIE